MRFCQGLAQEDRQAAAIGVRWCHHRKQEVPLSDTFTPTVTATARDWSGVHPANTAASHMAAQLVDTAAAFAALRGRLAFEAEPSAFTAALSREARA